jgi:hypothetical protein
MNKKIYFFSNALNLIKTEGDYNKYLLNSKGFKIMIKRLFN